MQLPQWMRIWSTIKTHYDCARRHIAGWKSEKFNIVKYKVEHIRDVHICKYALNMQNITGRETAAVKNKRADRLMHLAVLK